MKSIETEKKHLEKIEQRIEWLINMNYFERAQEEAEKAKKIRKRIKRAEEAKANPKSKNRSRFSVMDRVVKKMHIELAAEQANVQPVNLCAGTDPLTATAIIDEIIECEFDAEYKLTMIKLFLDNHLSSLEIGGILHDELIIIPRKRKQYKGE